MRLNADKYQIRRFNAATKANLYAGSGKNTYIPQIILQGNWLKDLGYDIGDKVIVDCQQDKLIITKRIIRPDRTTE